MPSPNDSARALNALVGDAPPREKMGSEFWSPVAQAETVVGFVTDFKQKTFAGKVRTSFGLSPVLHFPPGAAPVGFPELRVGYNAWLEKLVQRTDAGKVLAITYTGEVDTPAGKMFTFTVREVPEAKFLDSLKSLAPELTLVPA